MRKRRSFFELQCYNLNVCNIKPCHIYLAGCHNFDFKLVTWVYNVTFRLRLTHQYNKTPREDNSSFFYTRFLLSVVMFVFNVRTKVNSWNFMVFHRESKVHDYFVTNTARLFPHSASLCKETVPPQNQFTVNSFSYMLFSFYFLVNFYIKWLQIIQNKVRMLIETH